MCSSCGGQFSHASLLPSNPAGRPAIARSCAADDAPTPHSRMCRRDLTMRGGQYLQHVVHRCSIVRQSSKGRSKRGIMGLSLYAARLARCAARTLQSAIGAPRGPNLAAVWLAFMHSCRMNSECWGSEVECGMWNQPKQQANVTNIEKMVNKSVGLRQLNYTFCLFTSSPGLIVEAFFTCTSVIL